MDYLQEHSHGAVGDQPFPETMDLCNVYWQYLLPLQRGVARPRHQLSFVLIEQLLRVIHLLQITYHFLNLVKSLINAQHHSECVDKQPIQ